MTDPTIGQTVDADLAAVKAWIAKQEASALAKEHAFTTWLAKNWPHFVTWAGVAGGWIAAHLKL